MEIVDHWPPVCQAEVYRRLRLVGPPEVCVGAGGDRCKPCLTGGADAEVGLRQLDLAHRLGRVAIPVVEQSEIPAGVRLQRPVLRYLAVQCCGAHQFDGGRHGAEVECAGPEQSRCLAGGHVEAAALGRQLGAVKHDLGEAEQIPDLHEDLVGRGADVRPRLARQVVLELVEREVGKDLGGRVGGVGTGIACSHCKFSFIEHRSRCCAQHVCLLAGVGREQLVHRPAEEPLEDRGRRVMGPGNVPGAPPREGLLRQVDVPEGGIAGLLVEQRSSTPVLGKEPAKVHAGLGD